MTCSVYAAAAKARGEHGGAILAAQRYSRLFRTGAWMGSEPIETLVAPVHRTQTSESDEGTVTKFTQVVDAAGDGRPAGWIPDGSVGSDDEHDGVCRFLPHVLDGWTKTDRKESRLAGWKTEAGAMMWV